jgi:hypothetical protein
MQVEDERKIVLGAFLTVVFNLVVACFGMGLFASYYTPGNPTRPNRIDIDIVGYLGTSMGISQALYLTPLLVCASRSRKWNLIKGIASGGLVTAVLNIVLLLIFSKQ